MNSRRNERLERRELLYGVVRECMTATGILSSSYKFKVLSLDSSGRKYLIMVDMPREFLSNPSDFAEAEGTIARNAKERYDILVTAVYWRINELVSAAGVAAQRTAVPGVHLAKKEPAGEPAHASAERAPYAALQQEEVLAFKRAVAAAAQAATAQRSETRKVARHNAEQVPDFSNTEPFESNAPLGPTQFGGLS